MDTIMDIGRKHHLAVIEDACQAFGTFYQGMHVGTIGDVGAFSFQGTKIAVGGEGGMFVTNDDELYQRAKHYGTFCRNDAIQYLWSDDVGYNYRISNVTAALILAQVERINELIANKKRIFESYWEKMKDNPYVEMLVPPKNCEPNYSYVQGYLRDSVDVDRDALIREMMNMNIFCRPGYPSMHRMPPYEQTLEMYNSDRYDRRGIVFPMAHSLTEEDIIRVCAMMNQTIEKMLRENTQ